MSTVEISVIIPCFDEMANLQKGVLDRVYAYLSDRKDSFEVIIVDDGSKDGSDEFIEAFIKKTKDFHLIKNKHLGKAGAVTDGVLHAKGKIILFTDMDQATPIEQLDKLVPFFTEGYDIVIGSRNTERKGAPLLRRIISRSAVILRKVLVGMNEISDTQCGFKAFSSSAAKPLFQKIKEIHHGFRSVSGSNVTSGFDVELLYLAQKNGFRIQEVPVRWLHVETRRVNPLQDSIKGVFELLKIKSNALQGLYSSL